MGRDVVPRNTSEEWRYEMGNSGHIPRGLTRGIYTPLPVSLWLPEDLILHPKTFR